MLFLLKGWTFRLKLRALLKVTRMPGGARSRGAAGPRVTVKSCHPLSGHLTRGRVLLAREGGLGWGGQGAPARTQVQLCILLEALVVLLQKLETPASS